MAKVISKLQSTSRKQRLIAIALFCLPFVGTLAMSAYLAKCK